jgi:hypothetical protein
MHMQHMQMACMHIHADAHRVLVHIAGQRHAWTWDISWGVVADDRGSFEYNFHPYTLHHLPLPPHVVHYRAEDVKVGQRLDRAEQALAVGALVDACALHASDKVLDLQAETADDVLL